MSQTVSFFTLQPPAPYLPLSERNGKLPFPLTNDYMFKMVFQMETGALHALLCSLLDLRPQDIDSITVTNTLVPGIVITDKDTYLDIRMILNGNRIINLEMQVKNEHNWPERSLCYLCRSFNNLERGIAYQNVTPAHHIGILNFSLPHLRNQFYSHYYMANEATHEIISDKLRLSILNLTQTALATKYDKQAGRTRWARAFKATTWEEYQMLTKEDPIFEKVSDALYFLSQNREIAEQCIRMQEAAAEEAYIRQELAENRKALAEMNIALAEKDSELERLRALLREMQE